MPQQHPAASIRIAFIAALLLLSAVSDAAAYTQKVIYAFCSVAFCQDGSEPQGALLRDADGNIFGTAMSGMGPGGGGGGVFELIPNGSGWTERTIFALCTANGCPYGTSPLNGVIMDVSGNLYGTTNYEGISNSGAVFELIPNRAKTKWKAKLLLGFCSDGTCADGYYPNALTYAGQASGALYDGVSPLYGTTDEGGTHNGGVAYALTPPKPGKKKWKETIIHDFCSPNSSDGCTTDAATPEAGMIMDASGNLYGTTTAAGLHQFGAIFELSPRGRSWKEKILHNFCSLSGCADAPSHAPLLMDAAGALLGTAGNVFKFEPGTSKYTVLYKFCGDGTCSDGNGSNWSLTMDENSNLYGASFQGGAHNFGAVWALDPAFEDLYSFCSVAGCKDGMSPSSPLLIDASGDLIGTTQLSGPHNGGVVYELTP